MLASASLDSEPRLPKVQINSKNAALPILRMCSMYAESRPNQARALVRVRDEYRGAVSTTDRHLQTAEQVVSEKK